MKDEKKGKDKQHKEQEPASGGTAKRQEPSPDRTIEKKKEKEEPDHSEFNDWGNPLGESSDPGNQGKGI